MTIRSVEAFAFLVSLAWLAIYNGRFWGDTVHAMWHRDGRSLAFLLSLGIVVLCLQSLLLLLLPRRLLKFGTSLLFMVAAIGSYFSATYGVIMNSDMLRNVLQTDVVEAGELLNAQLVRWIVLLGVAPAIVVWKLNLPQNSWRQSTMRRVRTVAGILAACALALFMSSSSYASFFREHKPIRFMLSPAAPVASLVQLFADRGRDQDPWAAINASGAAVREAWAHRKPLLIVFMVGETARAADFQLGGREPPGLRGAFGGRDDRKVDGAAVVPQPATGHRDLAPSPCRQRSAPVGLATGPVRLAVPQQDQRVHVPATRRDSLLDRSARPSHHAASPPPTAPKRCPCQETPGCPGSTPHSSPP